MLNNVLSTKSKEVAIILTVETVGFLAHMDYIEKHTFHGIGVSNKSLARLEVTH